MSAIHTLASGAQYVIWRARLRDVMPHADGESNPWLWWARWLPRDSDERPIIVCGVRTKAECEAALERWDDPDNWT